MNYEKAYKEALEMASKIKLRNPIKRIQDEIDSIFPELHESEDERIRKMLIRIYKKADMGGEIFGEGITYKQVIAWLEKQSEQKPAWSEEDEGFLGDAIYAAKETYSENCGQEELIDWLKSIKDRVQPQPKQEWSEDDEAILDWCIADIERAKYCKSQTKPELCDKEINWLKSIKPNHWKPSEEQLNEVKEAIGVTGTNGIVLLSLYNDLKKL